MTETMDGFPSGQRGQTVNLLQNASVVRIHLHPFMYSGQDAVKHESMSLKLNESVNHLLVWWNRQTQET